MEKKKEPTIKQKLAMELVVENGGNVSKAMRDAGYSPATAKNPDKLTSSQSWQDLMDAYLPDDMLLRALSDDIEKKEGNRTAELTLAVKMKGKLTDKVDLNNPDGNLKTIIINKYGSHDKPTT